MRLPHPDVLANRFKEAEFAADLFAVDAGHASEDYCDAGQLLPHHLPHRGTEARADVPRLQRLAGTGGDPVIGLQTAFGGGKTHTMLAVYHLAKQLTSTHSAWRARNSLPQMGVQDLEAGKIAVFVGPRRAPTSLSAEGRAEGHTLWGYIAGVLPARQDLKLVARPRRRAPIPARS